MIESWAGVPLPLTELKHGHIVDPQGWTVAKCYGDYEAEYSRLIVTAVNAHAERSRRGASAVSEEPLTYVQLEDEMERLSELNAELLADAAKCREALTNLGNKFIRLSELNAELLAAAKRIVVNDAHSASDWGVIDNLKAAIANAEEQAP